MVITMKVNLYVIVITGKISPLFYLYEQGVNENLVFSLSTFELRELFEGASYSVRALKLFR